MTVIVRKKIELGTETVEVITFQPSGHVSKEERLRAERLDEFLQENAHKVADNILKDTCNEESIVRRWYLLGKWLREISGDSSLVSPSDVDSGVLWEAIWEHLPNSLKPKKAKLDQPYAEKRSKRKDHLSIAYEIGAFDWSDVLWVRRWDYWGAINFRPAILRDHRILRALGKEITNLKEYPDQDRFRTILKNLAEKFPVRRGKDTTVWSDKEIRNLVFEAVQNS